MRHFNTREDGSFRICQLTDIHFHSVDRFEEGSMTEALIRKALADTKPDLVVVTGDIAWGAEPEKSIARLDGLCAEAGVLWAPVLGNHDGEYFMETLGIPREDGRKMFADLLAAAPNSIFEYGEEGVFGNGNYLITAGGTEEAPAWALFLLDSHEGYFHLSQNLWYRRTSAALPPETKELAFFHVPFPEYSEVWDYTACKGFCLEPICQTEMNDGLFASMVRSGKMKGVFVGHDHINDFEGTLRGIRLTYGRACGYQTYGMEGYPRGARLIDLAPDGYKTAIYLEGGQLYEQVSIRRAKLARKHPVAGETVR